MLKLLIKRPTADQLSTILHLLHIKARWSFALFVMLVLIQISVFAGEVPLEPYGNQIIKLIAKLSVIWATLDLLCLILLASCSWQAKAKPTTLSVTGNALGILFLALNLILGTSHGVTVTPETFPDLGTLGPR